MSDCGLMLCDCQPVNRDCGPVTQTPGVRVMLGPANGDWGLPLDRGAQIFRHVWEWVTRKPSANFEGMDGPTQKVRDHSVVKHEDTPSGYDPHALAHKRGNSQDSYSLKNNMGRLPPKEFPNE